MLLLGPLTVADVPVPFLRAAAARGAVGLDAQGMVRHVEDGRIAHGPWPDRDAGLAAVAFLKVDDEEAAVLTGERDPERAALLLANRLGHPPREAIVSRAGCGALVCADGRVHRIAAFPVPEPVDPTGLGDTFFAAYLHRRLAGDDAAEAGRFAAATAALALGRFGPFAGSERDVRRVLGTPDNETGTAPSRWSDAAPRRPKLAEGYALPPRRNIAPFKIGDAGLRDRPPPQRYIAPFIGARVSPPPAHRRLRCFRGRRPCHATPVAAPDFANGMPMALIHRAWAKAVGVLRDATSPLSKLAPGETLPFANTVSWGRLLGRSGRSTDRQAHSRV